MNHLREGRLQQDFQSELAAIGWLPPQWRRPEDTWTASPPEFLVAVADAVSSVAESHDDNLLIRLRVSLDAARLEKALLTSSSLRNLAERHLKDVRRAQREYANLVPRSRSEDLSSGMFSVDLISDELAFIQHKVFHYIGSPRGGIHYGLVTRLDSSGLKLPLQLLTFSPFDLEYARGYIERQLPGLSVIMLSRAHAFASAPKNSFSFSFSRALKHMRSVKMNFDVVLTYVNPNVGFRGSSYLAANWVPFAEEPVVYLYAGDRYVSERMIKAIGIERNPVGLLVGNQTVTVSRVPLLPLRIMAYPVSDRARSIMMRKLEV